MVAHDDNRIIIALDDLTIQNAIDLGRKIYGEVWGFKIGLDSIHGSNGGHRTVRAVRQFANNNIFYDCKLHDTPDQISRAVRKIIPLRVKMFTVHCLGGASMMVSARMTADEESQNLGISRPLILGVTILTSMDWRSLKNLGFFEKCDYPTPDHQPEMIGKLAVNLAKEAKLSGLDGVICSAYEAADIKKEWPEAVVVTPGIRLLESQNFDQIRVATPDLAIKNLADYLVVGRDITQAKDPQEQVKKYNEIITNALEKKGN